MTSQNEGYMNRIESPVKHHHPIPAWVVTVSVGVVALIAGVGMGAAGASTGGGAPATLEPAQTVTAPAKIEVPASCIAALDGADRILGAIADQSKETVRFYDALPAMVQAAWDHDAQGLADGTAATKRMNSAMQTATDKIDGSTYGTDAADCKAVAHQ